MQEAQSKSFFRSSLFYWIVLFLVVVLVGGFFYWQYQKEDPVLKSLSADLQGDVDSVGNPLPPGVEVIEEGGKKRVKNHLDGYSLLTSLSSSVGYEKGVLTINEEIKKNVEIEGGAALPQYKIVVLYEKKNLEDWVKEWVEEQEYGLEYTITSQTYPNLGEVFLITVPSFGYLERHLVFRIEDKIYFIDYFLKDPEEIISGLTFN